MSSSLPEAYYLPVDEAEFDSTSATTSPWDDRMQHGGPPAALLTRAVELVCPDIDMQLARITVDMLAPIPQGRVRTEATVVRPGKRIQLVEAKMWVNGRLAVSATAWCTRRKPGSTSAQAQSPLPLPLPAEQPQEFFTGVSPDWGYGRSIEWRFASGSFEEPGPVSVWTRGRIPVVAGEAPTPAQRAAVVADSANGVSCVLPLSGWTFIPPTMTLTMAREPRGDWINLSARTFVSDSGTGITTGELSDTQGLCGSVSQPLLVDAR